MSTKAELMKLVTSWAKQALTLEEKSRKTCDNLKSGKLQQIDATIYSVYEDASSAEAFRRCAAQLKAVIIKGHIK